MKNEGLKAEVTLQGSAAKETWLRGELELDVFLLFENVDEKWIKEKSLDVLLKIARAMNVEYKKRYAEHPFLTLIIEGIRVDLVPALKVPSGRDAKTAVDRTPFHTAFVKSRLTEELKDEVRLLKRFFKGIEVYGAEIKVRGFSGYLTELLIIHYGGFKEVITEMSNWKPPVIIEKGTKRFEEPLVFADPVDPRRNAAAAVSRETLIKAVLAAWRYMMKPTPKFYFRPPPPEIEVGDRKIYLISIPFKPEESEEVIWGEFRRISSSLIKSLERRGFEVIRHELRGGKERVYLIIELMNDELSKYEVRVGPPIWDKDNLARFLDVYSPVEGPFIKGDRVVLVTTRRVRKLDKVIMSILKQFSTRSLMLEKASVEKVRELEKYEIVEWLRWFVYGKPWWWVP